MRQMQQKQHGKQYGGSSSNRVLDIRKAAAVGADQWGISKTHPTEHPKMTQTNGNRDRTVKKKPAKLSYKGAPSAWGGRWKREQAELPKHKI